MRKVSTKIINGSLRPYFGDEVKDSVLSCYLEDAELDFNSYLDEIAKAEKDEDVPTGVTFNQTNTEFYPEKAVIEALWFDEQGEPSDGENFAVVQLPLSEAKQLLLDWQTILSEWQASRP